MARPHKTKAISAYKMDSVKGVVSLNKAQDYIPQHAAKLAIIPLQVSNVAA